MKVKDLREKLAKLKKEEIIKLAVEFYKLVPKSKKEDYALDTLIDNPAEKKPKKHTATTISLFDIELQVSDFIENAKEQHYLFPNRVVPKKERSTWRFKVKKWHKELTNINRKDANLKQQAKILSYLYELICEACGYQYFSADDPFRSIGITQQAFYKSVLMLLQEAEGKKVLTEKGIQLIVNNYLDSYTLYSELMTDLIVQLNIPDLKYLAIAYATTIIREDNFIPQKETKRGFMFFSKNDDFRQSTKHNNLVKFVFLLRSSLFEFEEAVAFFNKKYYERKDEVKLYILIRMLLKLRKKEFIKREIETAINNGIEPRKSLFAILAVINNGDELPQYM